MGIDTIRPRPFSDSSPDHADSFETYAPRRSVNDPFCILVWKFRVPERFAEAFAALCEESSRRLHDQPKALFQRVTRRGNELRVHVGLEDSFGVLTHVVEFSQTLKLMRTMGRYNGVEVHGPGIELDLLREPLRRFRPLFIEQDGNVLV
jgi:hypothetical protein